MRPEVKVEYDRILGKLTVRNGSLLKQNPTSRFMLYDRHTIAHAGGCVTSVAKVEEDIWYEFQGTFANDHSVHGITATGVTCTCGVLQDRTFRWQASVSEVAEAVFEEAFDTSRENGQMADA